MSKNKNCEVCWQVFEPFDIKRSSICENEECRQIKRKKTIKSLKLK